MVFKSWYLSHENICSMNHTPSSESMEKAAAVEMFGRSISLHNYKHTAYVGDIFRRGWVQIWESMKEMQREKSLMGAVGSRGRQTDAVIDNFQNYYGAVKRNNKNFVRKTKDAIWTCN